MLIVAAMVSILSTVAPVRLARPLLAIAVLCFGTGYGILRWHESSSDRNGFEIDPGSIIRVDARMLSDPETTSSGHSFRIAATTLDPERKALDVSGILIVRVSHPIAPRLRAGDMARVTGVFEPIRGPRNPGESDRRFRAAEQEIIGTLSLNHPALLDVTPAFDLRARLLRARADLKARAQGVIAHISGSNTNPERHALLSALLTGERRGDHREVQRVFQDTGLAHALSISGFHIAVLAALLTALLTFFGERGMPMFVLIAAILLAYMAIVVPSAPVTRSILLVLIVGVVEWSGRRYDRITLLLWIAFALLIITPSDLWNLGYQLSVGLTILLMWCGESARDRMFGCKLKGLKPTPWTVSQLLARGTATAIASSVLCAAVSMPLILHHTGRITPLAAIASVVISPLVVLLLVFGYITLLIGMCFPSVAPACSAPMGVIADLSLNCASIFDSIPGSAIDAPAMSLMWTVVATGFAIAWITRPIRFARAALAFGILGIWALFGAAETTGIRSDVALRVDALDVGSGTCMILRSGDDTLMFDCGSMRHSDARTILNACRTLGVSELPLVIVSHPDSDHFGFLPQITDSIPVGCVVVSPRFLEQDEDSAAANCARALEASNIPVRILTSGDSFNFGELRVNVLSPDEDATFRHDNDHSLVLEFNHDSFDRPILLLTGDVQDDAIQALRPRVSTSPIIMEAPHHGSARQSAIDWLHGLEPEVILQSTDASRLDDPRWSEVRASAAWHSTASSGAISVEFTRDGQVLISSMTGEH